MLIATARDAWCTNQSSSVTNRDTPVPLSGAPVIPTDDLRGLAAGLWLGTRYTARERSISCHGAPVVRTPAFKSKRC